MLIHEKVDGHSLLGSVRIYKICTSRLNYFILRRYTSEKVIAITVHDPILTSSELYLCDSYNYGKPMC